MARAQRIDIAKVIAATRDERPGWRKGLVTFGPPHAGQRGVEGLVDADNQAWEITYRWPAGRASMNVDVAQHIDLVMRSGYTVRLIDLDGESFVVEYQSSARLWDGLLRGGIWKDESAGGCPWQMSLEATWTHPGGLVSEAVELYVRWRSWGVDSEGTLWTGHVIRRQAADSFRCPWSPNLLPTLRPRDAPAPEPTPTPTLLSSLLGGSRPRPAEIGFTEDQEEQAQHALVLKAETWLRAHGLDPTSWGQLN